MTGHILSSDLPQPTQPLNEISLGRDMMLALGVAVGAGVATALLSAAVVLLLAAAVN